MSKLNLQFIFKNALISLGYIMLLMIGINTFAFITLKIIAYVWHPIVDCSI